MYTHTLITRKEKKEKNNKQNPTKNPNTTSWLHTTEKFSLVLEVIVKYRGKEGRENSPNFHETHC